MSYPILTKIREFLSLTEAAVSQKLTDPEFIATLAVGAVKFIKANNDKSLDELPMAIITQQVRSHVDGELESQKITPSTVVLNALVSNVIDHIRTNLRK